MAALMSEKNVDNLSRAVDNVATASEGMKELPKVMAALREMLSETNIRRWSALLAHLEKAGSEAAPLTAEVREMVKGMTALSRRLDHVAGELGADTLPQANALLRDLQTNSRQMARILEILEESPQAFVFGRGAQAPGPGESGGAAPAR
jgi:phospholipid/cholesterol/gamma-HCH transport system substrate-binding protein